MTSSPSLPDMPDKVMKHILKDVDFKSIQVLRKVCHKLRDYVNEKKPDPTISEVHIHVEPTHLRVNYTTKNKEIYQIFYQDGKPIRQSKDGILVNEDVLTSCCNDLELNLRNEKTILRKLEISRNPISGRFEQEILKSFFEKIRQVLKSRKNKLRVRWTKLEINNQEQVKAITENVVEDGAIRLDLIAPGCKNGDPATKTLDISEIHSSKMWIYVEQLFMPTFIISSPIWRLNYHHRGTYTVQKVDASDLWWLTENINCVDRTFDYFDLYYLELIDQDRYFDGLTEIDDYTGPGKKYHYADEDQDGIINIYHFVDKKNIYLKCVSPAVLDRPGMFGLSLRDLQGR